MATMAPPPRPKKGAKSHTPLGNSGGRIGYGGDGPGGYEAALPERRYQTGMMLGLAGIVMFFTALTSAYIISQGISPEWSPTGVPGLLWWNTAVLLLSSCTLEKARRSASDALQFRTWWGVATALGLLFLAGQLMAWRQLAARGLYLDTTPSSSYFYLLTGAHGIHLLGGVIALSYVLLKTFRRQLAPANHVAVRVTALYWHFMDGLWIYLFLLLLLWR